MLGGGPHRPARGTAAPAPGTWGNLGFNAIRGPGRDNWNISLFKSFIISEPRGSRVEFRADGFYERFAAKGQIERVARIHRELARAAGVQTRSERKAD